MPVIWDRPAKRTTRSITDSTTPISTTAGNVPSTGAMYYGKTAGMPACRRNTTPICSPARRWRSWNGHSIPASRSSWSWRCMPSIFRLMWMPPTPTPPDSTPVRGWLTGFSRTSTVWTGRSSESWTCSGRAVRGMIPSSFSCPTTDRPARSAAET